MLKPLRIVPLRSKLTARAGLVAVSKLLRHHAQLPQVLDPKFPVSGGFADSAVAISYVALLCQGITEFDAIENMRCDATFAHSLGMPSLPSAPTVRQRVEQRRHEWLGPLFDANARLLTRAKVAPNRGGSTAPLTAMSLIATAKAHGHDPLAYLTDVLTRLPGSSSKDLEALLPMHWQPVKS